MSDDTRLRSAAGTGESGGPPGWSVLGELSPFSRTTGPVYVNPDRPRRYGLRVLDHHGNGWGMLHGGAIMSFGDVAFGDTIRTLYPAGVSNRTVSMTVNFVDSVALGGWVEAEVTVVRAGRSTAFLEAAVDHAGRPVARLSGVFSIRVPDEGAQP